MKKTMLNGYTLILLMSLMLCPSTVIAEKNVFSYKGFIEYETFAASDTEGSFQDRLVKNEIRSRNVIRYGKYTHYVYTVADLYIQSSVFNDSTQDRSPYSQGNKLYRNLRFSDTSYEINLNELYYNYEHNKIRLRIGNQIYSWGTADVFNPTAYFNPLDMREFIFKSEDQQTIGVPSVSGMFFIGDYTLETVFAPVHTGAVLPEKTGYWYLAIDNYLFPITIDAADPLSVDISHAGFGTRLSTSLDGCDISGSLYYGPDNNPLYKPQRVNITNGQPVSIAIRPSHQMFFSVGFDFSMSLKDVVIQLEAAWSPNKTGYKLQDFDNPQNIVFPFETEKSGYIAYTAGFNYFIPLYKWFENHEGDPVFTVEWSEATYLKNDLSPPLLTDMISLKLEDQFLSSRLKMSVSCVFDTVKTGYTLWVKAGWDFQNHWSTELSYGQIDSSNPHVNTTDTLFYYYRNNDTIMMKVKYDFY